MKILVANLGSTSFKYRLFDMADEQVLARGGVERIGSDQARCYVTVGAAKEEAELAARDHAVAVQLCLRQLSDPKFNCLRDPAERLYAVPLEWAMHYGVQRWGFHGASHRYIAERTAQLLGNPDAKIISCHLGGSSSLCAISEGMSEANSLGMSPQSGLPHNNRVGDFDPFAIPVIMRATGKTLEQVLDDLANRSGLMGLSCGYNDLRDIEEDAKRGGPVSQQA